MNNIDQDHSRTRDHISVCTCTYRRPEMLTRALDSVVSQATGSQFTFEIVIVDNDKMRSAEALVSEYHSRGQWKILYDCEPEQGIPFARNRSVRNAGGNLIAIVDDDECPAQDWLLESYHCLQLSGADGVLGPVLPHFPPGAPEWLKKSGLCDRPRNSTGSPITEKDLRTGNVLLRRHVFEGNTVWFDPERALTGGSDGEFLLRQINTGRRITWCDEAVVLETVAQERWALSYYVRRQFRIGTLAGTRHRRKGRAGAMVRSTALSAGYTLLQPILFLSKKHIWAKVLVRLSYHIGFVLSYAGLVSAKYRE